MGVIRELLVSHDHSSAWFVSSGPSGGKDAPPIGYRPWMNLESCDPNMMLLEKYQHAVLAFILAHPGITSVSTFPLCLSVCLVCIKLLY